MRYLVLALTLECADNGPDEEPGDAMPECRRVTVCKDSREVHRAVRAVADAGDDWRLFEVMPDGRTAARAVVFKFDGKVSYDVEIS